MSLARKWRDQTLIALPLKIKKHPACLTTAPCWAVCPVKLYVQPPRKFSARTDQSTDLQDLPSAHLQGCNFHTGAMPELPKVCNLLEAGTRGTYMAEAGHDEAGN